jgi:hypothetical protein
MLFLLARLALVILAAPVIALVVLADSIVRFGWIMITIIRNQTGAHATQAMPSTSRVVRFVRKPTHGGSEARH